MQMFALMLLLSAGALLLNYVFCCQPFSCCLDMHDMPMFVLMCVSAVILNMDQSSDGSASNKASLSLDPNYSTGLICVLVASMLSGVSAALTQKVSTCFCSPRTACPACLPALPALLCINQDSPLRAIRYSLPLGVSETRSSCLPSWLSMVLYSSL
jgi:hypothetical protein